MRDLLTHRGGLGNAEYLWYESDIPAADVRRRVRFLQPAYSLRSSFLYLPERHVRSRRRRILDPLGMARTVTPLREAQARDNMASPHCAYRS